MVFLTVGKTLESVEQGLKMTTRLVTPWTLNIICGCSHLQISRSKMNKRSFCKCTPLWNYTDPSWNPKQLLFWFLDVLTLHIQLKCCTRCCIRRWVLYFILYPAWKLYLPETTTLEHYNTSLHFLNHD